MTPKQASLFTDEERAKARASFSLAKNATEVTKQAGLDVSAAVEAKIVARVDSMPVGCRATYLKAMRGRSLAAAVKAFCLECVQWEREEVRRCTAPACPLFPYRPFIEHAGGPQEPDDPEDPPAEPAHVLTALLGWISVLSTLALLSCTPPAPASPLSAPLTWNAARTGNRPQGDVANYPSAMSLAAMETEPAPAAPVHDSPEPTAARASTTDSMCPRWREMSHWASKRPSNQGSTHENGKCERGRAPHVPDAGAPPPQAGAGPAGHMDSILRAIRHVETGGALRTPAGDSGAAIGPYQIHRSYWVDAKMPDGTYQNCRDRRYAERVMLRYWRRWCPQALVAGDWRALANVHHLGGPAARRGEWDAEYVQKVRAEMESA